MSKYIVLYKRILSIVSKIKYYIYICIISLLFLIINSLFITNLNTNRIEISSGSYYSVEGEPIFPDTFKTKEDFITQYFQPAYSGLATLQIRLAYNDNDLLAKYQSVIRLIIRDKNEKILEEKEFNSTNINNWKYLSYSPDINFKKGEKYSITLDQLSGPVYSNTETYPISFVPFLLDSENSGEVRKENLYCEYNGYKQDNNWDIVYVYSIMDDKQIAIIIAVNISLIFFLIGLTFLLHIYKSKKITILFTAFSPFLNFIVIESITGNIASINFLYAIYNIIILYTIYALLITFFKNIKVPLILIHIILPALSLVEYYVYKLRGRSFMLQDIRSFQTAKSVMSAYSYDIELTLCIALLSAVGLLYIVLVIPNIIIDKFNKRRKVSVLLICLGAGTIFSNKTIMQRFDAMSFNMWDIESNYQQKGYILTLISEIQFLTENPPLGYSLEAVEQISEKYLNSYSANSKSPDIQPENVILIMNESWADLRYLGQFDQQDNITPYIDNLSENTIKGYVHVPVFGAGTANSEYEVLTGNSMQIPGAANTAYQFYTSSDEWGMASTLKEQGYTTIALHPNLASNWNRNIVYPRMKFDQFISWENWPVEYTQNIRWCTSDKSSFDELISIYKNKKKNEKLFSFLVTMQNHGGYNWTDYESTIKLNYNSAYPLTEQYLSLLQETDKAFSYLIEYFKNVNEPTMIIMFGDHLPNIDISFYEMLLNEKWDEMDLITKQGIYATPFVIWTNYGMISETNVEMSANYFGSYILKLAGLKMTDYNKCLLQFLEKIPVIGTGLIRGQNNVWHSIYELPDELNSVFLDYQILQYNNMFDKKGRINTLFTLSNS